MNKDFTEIVFVLDRSGSMQPIWGDATGGYNNFIAEQRKLPGQACATLVAFDDKYEVAFEAIDIKELQALDYFTFFPRGYTALLDAIGRTIDNVGERLRATAESNRPGKVIVVIITDGEENRSHLYSQEKIHEMITRQRQVYNWEFVFLGANMDAFSVAQDYGIAMAMTSNFEASRIGTQDAYTTINSRVTALRAT